ncbi:U11/U12 small nuclear ribonucleoprotein 25 kDa protein-like [Phalaenopsis equestris]|uniref:U11/U12 small nuclear ribonucleoprotein 25 kDa protein-like n=1 Tax=Phalaenopsis equestris TaxID=78828 RepID=UPI0009E1E9D1|nr:U11/U12 small nuclear ribonucleoprotein 25 kDa protein-like [Phalaenopsis equestris]
MPTIAGVEDKEPRLSLPHRPFSSDSAALRTPDRRSFSYYRLPVHLLNLTVLKLDGSSFDVQVPRTASVRELKMAVEEVFDKSQMDRRTESISWVHVWGQFCLSYRGIKLTQEKALLKDFGIKDSDLLQFVRHGSISCTPIKQRRRGQERKPEWRRKSWSGEELNFEFEESATDNRSGELIPAINEDTNQSTVEWVAMDGGEDEDFAIKNHWQFKLSRYLKGFLCYSNFIYTTRDRIALD